MKNLSSKRTDDPESQSLRVVLINVVFLFVVAIDSFMPRRRVANVPARAREKFSWTNTALMTIAAWNRATAGITVE